MQHEVGTQQKPLALTGEVGEWGSELAPNIDPLGLTRDISKAKLKVGGWIEP